MPITYTKEFSNLIDERFSKSALTTAFSDNGYSFVGAQAIEVTSVPTVPMNDYKREGNARFGEAKELENVIQTLTMTQDRSFTFTLDNMNEEETKIAFGDAMARQLREVAIPEIDTYRFKKATEGAGKVVEVDLTKENVYDAITDATAHMDEKLVPEGRVIYINPATVKLVKHCEEFVKNGDLAQDQILFKGQIGMIDGMAVVVVPANRLGVSILVAHHSAIVAPVKLQVARVHQNPVGIDGQVGEGRLYYDAFVLNQKKDGLYVIKPKAAPETKTAARTTAK